MRNQLDWQRERQLYEKLIRPFSTHRIRGLNTAYVNGVEKLAPLRREGDGSLSMPCCSGRPLRWVAQFGEYICTGCGKGRGH